jgi:mitochondrial fission protein ELM1
LPFECNLQRYTADSVSMLSEAASLGVPVIVVGLCRLNQVDP